VEPRLARQHVLGYVGPMNHLAQYIFAAMTSWTPLSDHAFHEGSFITQARYDDIAQQIVDQAMEPSEAPLFSGQDGRVRTAMLLVAIASFESGGFATDVHFCDRGGDSGKAWSLFQSHRNKTELCSSVRNAAHIALDQIRESFATCHDLPQNQRLSGYASGNCVDGRAESVKRFDRAKAYMDAHPFASFVAP